MKALALAVADVAGALERLPELGAQANGGEVQATRATGTDGKPVACSPEGGKSLVTGLVTGPQGISRAFVSPEVHKCTPEDSGQGDGQKTQKAPENMGFSEASEERRAWDSNPQPVARHLISSQAANRSRTLRTALILNVMPPLSSGKDDSLGILLESCPVKKSDPRF
jgi:hypothetical protein